MNTRRLIALVALILLALTASPAVGAAWAKDDFLDSSDPAPHQELNRVPGWVTLVFKADADASLATILVQDADGASVTAGPLIVEGTNVTTQLRSGLPKGTYTVHYRTTDEFGERRGGAFQFAYGKGSWTTLDSEVWQGESAQPTILDDPDPTSATPTPSATITPTPTSMPTSSAPTAAATPTPTAQPSPGGDVPLLPWLIGGGLVVVAAAGVAWYFARGRRRP